MGRAPTELQLRLQLEASDDDYVHAVEPLEVAVAGEERQAVGSSGRCDEAVGHAQAAAP